MISALSLVWVLLATATLTLVMAALVAYRFLIRMLRKQPSLFGAFVGSALRSLARACGQTVLPVKGWDEFGSTLSLPIEPLCQAIETELTAWIAGPSSSMAFEDDP